MISKITRTTSTGSTAAPELNRNSTLTIKRKARPIQAIEKSAKIMVLEHDRFFLTVRYTDSTLRKADYGRVQPE